MILDRASCTFCGGSDRAWTGKLGCVGMSQKGTYLMRRTGTSSAPDYESEKTWRC